MLLLSDQVLVMVASVIGGLEFGGVLWLVLLFFAGHCWVAGFWYWRWPLNRAETTEAPTQDQFHQCQLCWILTCESIWL